MISMKICIRRDGETVDDITSDILEWLFCMIPPSYHHKAISWPSRWLANNNDHDQCRWYLGTYRFGMEYRTSSEELHKNKGRKEKRSRKSANPKSSTWNSIHRLSACTAKSCTPRPLYLSISVSTPSSQSFCSCFFFFFSFRNLTCFVRSVHTSSR